MTVAQSSPSFNVGHPVRRFVLTVLGVAALLVAVWWSAVLAPRVSASSSEGEHDLATGRGRTTIDIDNAGLASLRVVAVEVDGGATILGATIDGVVAAGASPSLKGRTSTELVVHDESRPCPGPGGGRSFGIHVDVEGPFGPPRTAHVNVAPVVVAGRPC